MDIFTLTAPTVGATPVLVEIPHAGLAVPDGVREQLQVSRRVILRDSDVYVDKLYDGVHTRGATVLAALVSRYVVDLNRSPDDVDSQTVPDHPDPRGVQPRGVVWRVTTEGRPALREPLTYRALEERLRRYHAPYHATLQRTIASLRERFGYVILLAAHSMPSVSRVGRGSVTRADVVPGTRGRSTAAPEVIDAVDAHFRDAGLSVRHDEPYRGGWTTSHYGRPAEGVHAVQIELNRALYMDESTGRPKDDAFDALRVTLASLVERMGTLEPRSS